MLEIDGVGESKLEKIMESWRGQRSIRMIMVFLQKHGLSIKMANKIYNCYGMDAIEVIRENPYKLIEDIKGIGFSTADTIAISSGIKEDDPNRLKAVLLYIVGELESSGHTAPSVELIIDRFSRLCDGLKFPDRLLEELIDGGQLIKNGWNGKDYISSPILYEMEKGIASRLKTIIETPFPLRSNYVDTILENVLKEFPKLTKEQLGACRAIFENKILILTGGPGTGKTTTLKAIIKSQKMIGAKILLCAPTGRAAQQMKEATGYSSSTIHRLIKFMRNGVPEYNSENPLSCDLLIVDEVSMIDVRLMFYLVNSLPPGSKLLLVGDRNQIPSVGPGNVLADLITSKRIFTINLTKIFRQSGRSDIVRASHDILNGRIPENCGGKELSEYYFIDVDDSERPKRIILKMIKERIPLRYGIDPKNDVQILSPMYKGNCGVDLMNYLCQENLNENSRRIIHRGNVFKLGDRVINLENNYEKMVFNGDCGVISGIENVKKVVTVDFGDRAVTYEIDELDNLRLSYAITIHKSQGSEYPAVIIPVFFEHYHMLKRNLLYTAVSRGRKLVVIVGSRKALIKAVKDRGDTRRITLLEKFMKEE